MALILIYNIIHLKPVIYILLVPYLFTFACNNIYTNIEVGVITNIALHLKLKERVEILHKLLSKLRNVATLYRKICTTEN